MLSKRNASTPLSGVAAFSPDAVRAAERAAEGILEHDDAVKVATLLLTEAEEK